MNSIIKWLQFRSLIRKMPTGVICLPKSTKRCSVVLDVLSCSFQDGLSDDANSVVVMTNNQEKYLCTIPNPLSDDDKEVSDKISINP